jgi:hypothetical protein
MGKESGPRLAEVQAATAFQCIRYEDGFRCFKRLLTLQHLLDPFKRVAREGDSGSWIIDAEDGLVSWHGMVIAVQGPIAYACFAEDIMRELANAHLGAASMALPQLQNGDEQ